MQPFKLCISPRQMKEVCCKGGMMTKIEAYNNKKRESKWMGDFLKEIDQAECDKFYVKIAITDALYGFYGNSSCSRWPDIVIKETQKELHRLIRFAIRDAAVRVKKETEAARIAARDEAEEILKDIDIEENNETI